MLKFSWFEKKHTPSPANIDLAFMKKNCRILFIDDHDVPLIITLKNEGWCVDYWEDVKRMSDLESGQYDLIFLDIGGVGIEYSPKEEGLGILRRLKDANPSVLVIAYSSQEYDFEKQKFYEIADAKLSKSSGALQAMSTIEELLKKKWTIEHQLENIETILLLSKVEKKQIEAIKTILITKHDTKKFDSAIKGLKISGTVITIVTKIAYLIMSFYK